MTVLFNSKPHCIPVFPLGLQLQGGGTSAAARHVGDLSLTPSRCPPPDRKGTHGERHVET